MSQATKWFSSSLVVSGCVKLLSVVLGGVRLCQVVSGCVKLCQLCEVVLVFFLKL